MAIIAIHRQQQKVHRQQWLDYKQGVAVWLLTVTDRNITVTKKDGRTWMTADDEEG
jgi:hypothetical protein